MTKVCFSYILGLCQCFLAQAPKPIGMSCDESHKGGVFYYVNEVSLGKPLGNLRMGASFPGEPTL